MTERGLVQACGGPGLAELLERARYGTYFDILGLGRDASFGDVARRAQEFGLLLDRLAEEPLDPASAGALEEIRWSVGEAWRVLSNPRLRERYALGLARILARDGEHHGPAHR